jgi:hypothetical protein
MFVIDVLKSFSQVFGGFETQDDQASNQAMTDVKAIAAGDDILIKELAQYCGK